MLRDKKTEYTFENISFFLLRANIADNIKNKRLTMKDQFKDICKILGLFHPKIRINRKRMDRLFQLGK